MKVTLLGAKGMFGHLATRYFEENGVDVLGVARGACLAKRQAELDLSDSSGLRCLLRAERPDFVVNAAGVLNQSVADNMDQAILINAWLPHYLARLGRESGFATLHLSTDCIFSGSRGSYRVDEPSDASTPYARTKALGELNNERDLTIRTTIVGPELSARGVGLLQWFMRAKGECQGYSQVFWSGLTTLELAKLMLRLMREGLPLRGIYQCSPGSRITKYDLLRLFNEIFREGELTINEYADYHSDKSLLNSRPEYYPLPDYRAMLLELRQWIAGHPQLYLATDFKALCGS